MQHIKNVLPSFHIIAETKLIEEGVRGFFNTSDQRFYTSLEEKNKNKITDVEKMVEVVGNISKKLPSRSVQNNREYINKIKSINEEILKHTQISIAFNNVSQTFIDLFYKMRNPIEITQRELEKEELKFWLLPTYEDDEKLAFKFAELFESYGKLKESLEVELAKKSERNAEKDFEAIKRLLPNTYALDAVMTSSLYTWREVIFEYTNFSYDDEIRYVLLFLAKTLKNRYQNAFHDLVLVDREGAILGLDSLKVDGKIWRNARVTIL